MKLLTPFSESVLNSTDNCESIENISTEGIADNSDGKETDEHTNTDLHFYLTDEKASARVSEILMNERVSSSKGLDGRLNVIVTLPEKIIHRYNTRLLSSLPEVFKSGFFAKRPQETVSLYNCLEAFLKQEPLGPDDMWLVLFTSLVS